MSLLVESLCATIGNFKLENVSLNVPEGRVLSILGPSGCGKTVLLRCIAGLHPTSSGRVVINARDVTKLPPKERRVGFVFQNYALFPHLDSAINLGFPLFLRGMKKQIVRSHARETATELDGLPTYLDKYPSELPEGMKQLVAIGRERFHEFDILLLDEPMSQLDAKIHIEMRGYIKKLVREFGKTTVVVFSDPDDAMALGDLMAVMESGKILQQGPTKEVYGNPSSLTAMEITSKFEINRIDVSVHGGKTEPLGLFMDAPDGEYILAFRPNEVKLGDEGIPFKMMHRFFYDGRRVLAECETPFGNMWLLLPAHQELPKAFLPTNPKLFALQ